MGRGISHKICTVGDGGGALPIPPKDQQQKETSDHTDESSRAHEPGYIVQASVHLYYVSANAF
jgi:hypothetical protein